MSVKAKGAGGGDGRGSKSRQGELQTTVQF